MGRSSIVAVPPRSGTVVDARMSLAMWLRAGRSQRNMSLEDVARITKIQPRILERLEAGTIKPGDGMPADVFVRGFVRSIAKCVGLDEAEAVRRYTEAAAQAALELSPVTAGPSARAFVESMSELAPQTARSAAPRLLDAAPVLAAGSAQDLPRVEALVEGSPLVEPAVEVVAEAAVLAPIVVVEAEVAPNEVPTIEVAPIEVAPTELDGKKKKSKKATGKGRGKRKAMATGTPFEPMPVVAQPAESIELAQAELAAAENAAQLASEPSIVESSADQPTEPANERAFEIHPAPIVEPGATWSPRMPVVIAPTVPWRIAASAQSLARSKSTARVVPSLVIDDADPELAERELDDRQASREPVRRSFLPPILMDREDRSARQGGLTLAVIILLIAATLTLSYLMRRPSSSGDGVTQADRVQSVDQLG